MKKIITVVGAAMLWLLHLLPAQAQWVQVPQVPATTVFALSAHQNTVYAGTGQELHFGTGTTWTTSTVHQSQHDIEAITFFNGSLYAGTYGNGLFRSTDGGQNWQALTQGLNSQHITGFAHWGSDLYVSTDGGGIYKLNAGTTGWEAVNTGLFFSSFNTLAAAGNRLLAGASLNGHYYTLDQGQSTWSIVQLTSPVNIELGVNSFAVSGDTIFAGTNFRVLTSTDHGQTWTYDREGIDPGAWTQMAIWQNLVLAAVTKNNGSSRVYYRSLNQPLGATWQLLSDLPTNQIYKIAVHNGKLYAGRNDGLHFYDLTTLTAAPNPSESAHAHLGTPYPNPTENAAAIPYSLATNTQQAYLQIIELSTGRKVKQVQLSTESNQAEYWVSGLSAGVYSCQLVADEQVIGFQKLVVLH